MSLDDFESRHEEPQEKPDTTGDCRYLGEDLCIDTSHGKKNLGELPLRDDNADMLILLAEAGIFGTPTLEEKREELLERNKRPRPTREEGV
ncbi:MAG TPA: hypothetical protein ENI70_01015 [Candidatus Peregrinibacteria bacterium]|nr:hypothetical protein [Candidatus Peregrinibacteria bacterium]